MRTFRTSSSHAHDAARRERLRARIVSTARRPPTRYALPCTVVLIVAALTACAPPPIADDGYELVFHDDFDGTRSAASGPRRHSAARSAHRREGVMTLRATAANGYHWAYVASTGPRSTAEPSYPWAQSWRYGYFEARIRFTDNRWAWPAFWLFSMATSEAWPREDCRLLNAEWDIMEGGIGGYPASESTYAVLHRNTTDNTADGYCGIPDEQRKFRTTPATSTCRGGTGGLVTGRPVSCAPTSTTGRSGASPRTTARPSACTSCSRCSTSPSAQGAAPVPARWRCRSTGSASGSDDPRATPGVRGSESCSMLGEAWHGGIAGQDLRDVARKASSRTRRTLLSPFVRVDARAAPGPPRLRRLRVVGPRGGPSGPVRSRTARGPGRTSRSTSSCIVEASQVVTIDPTPRAIAYVREVDPGDDRFSFVPDGPVERARRAHVLPARARRRVALGRQPAAHRRRRRLHGEGRRPRVDHGHTGPRCHRHPEGRHRGSRVHGAAPPPGRGAATAGRLLRVRPAAELAGAPAAPRGLPAAPDTASSDRERWNFTLVSSHASP